MNAEIIVCYLQGTSLSHRGSVVHRDIALLFSSMGHVFLLHYIHCSQRSMITPGSGEWGISSTSYGPSNASWHIKETEILR